MAVPHIGVVNTKSYSVEIIFVKNYKNLLGIFP